MLRRRTRAAAFLLALVLAAGNLLAAEDDVSIKGSLWSLYLNQHHNYFGPTSAKFVETIARVGADLKLAPDVTAEVQWAAQQAALQPGNYTGASAGDWLVELDLANVTFQHVDGSELRLTVGRQNLEFGDGFLVYDFVADSRCLLLTPLRAAWGLRADAPCGEADLTAFWGVSDPDYRSYETTLAERTVHQGRRRFLAIDARERTTGTPGWELGAFFRDDGSAVDSDTLALTARLARQRRLGRAFGREATGKLTLELIDELGTTRVSGGRLTPRQVDRRSLGGYVEAQATFDKARWKPYLMGRYFVMPGDDPATTTNEAFDPLFYGFKDYGRWYFGNINGFSLANSNERVAFMELGFYPWSAFRVRLQGYSIDLDRPLAPGAGRSWSDEVNLIGEWTPDKHWFVIGELGLASPRETARVALGAETTREHCLWVGYTF